MTGLYSVSRIRYGVSALALLAIAGCQATSTPVEAPAPEPSANVKTMPAPAPTAQEMEGGLAKTNGHSSDPAIRRVEVQVAESERPAEARPSSLPEIRPGSHPAIDEETEISTRELHGYNFPGLESVREPAMARVEPAPTPEPAPEPEPEPTPAPEPEPEVAAVPEPVVEEVVPVEAPVTEEPVVEAEPTQVEVDVEIEIETPAPESPADAAAPALFEVEPVPATTPAQQVLSEFTPIVNQYEAPPTTAYLIGAGDTLEFQSFNDPLLSRELIVRFDGHISLPLIADVNVEGLTREAAETQIREAYRTVFRGPQISLLVQETASKTYALIGDVEQPGVYPFLRPTKLIEALSLAGGLRRRNSSSSVGGFVGVTGQLTKAFIIRHRDGERMVLQYDLRELGHPGAHASDAPVYHGDLIYVPEGVNLVYLLGESRNSVIVELTEGMTLLQMLSLSGGFDPSTGRIRNVVLMRQKDGESTQVMNVNLRKILKTGEDILLQPGDIIYIPRKLLVELAEFVGRFTGSVSPVLEMYNTAVESYYARDFAQNQLRASEVSRTLERLGEIEQFGSSTQNITELFGAP